LRNSSIASPGLKHHQLRVIEALPANTWNRRLLKIQPTDYWGD
jgi:hypothetical protein